MSFQIVCCNSCKVTLVTFVYVFFPEFSNVFLNCLSEQMQSYIGCICMIFRQIELLNVFSNCLPKQTFRLFHLPTVSKGTVPTSNFRHFHFQPGHYQPRKMAKTMRLKIIRPRYQSRNKLMPKIYQKNLIQGPQMKAKKSVSKSVGPQNQIQK